MKKIIFCFCFIFLVLEAYCIGINLQESDENIEAKVKFFLYTARNPQEPQLLAIDDVNSVKNSYFDPSLQTKFIIHGWNCSYQEIPNNELREAYLSQENLNIISVDWSEAAKTNYITARGKFEPVGQVVAKFLDFLNEKCKTSFKSLVVIGHSLGAHVAGFCGKSVKRGKLPAIVGLDAALPSFAVNDSRSRLSSSDADFVMSIHSNALLKGFLEPIGTASFYPNWGREQPGCGKDPLGDCAHDRCVYYYAEAIKGYSFAPIFKCENFENILLKRKCKEVDKSAQIGDPTKVKHVPGIFYFETRSEAPFGKIEK